MLDLQDRRVHGYAYSPEEAEATRTVAAWMTEARLKVRFDPVGNLFGRLPGRRPGPAILTGSHLDCVPNGVTYDGPAGEIRWLPRPRSSSPSNRAPRSRTPPPEQP